MVKSISKPALRQHVRRVGRAVYWRLPPAWRDSVVEFSYRHAGEMFKGFGHYETWRARRRDAHILHGEPGRARLTDLDHVAALAVSPGRIAIHAHVYYHDLARALARELRHIPYQYDLFVSVPNEEGRRSSERAFGRLRNLGKLTIEVVPNRGRDIAPMLCAFGDRLRDYDYFAHVHTKRSLYNKGATDGWREYLWGALFGDSARIRKIFTLLSQGAAIVYPQTFHRVPYAGSTWLANRSAGQAWGTRLGVREVPKGYFDFPVGSMFWARMDAMRPLFDSGITLDDFEPESGQNDGTFAHVVERMLGVVARYSGRSVIILRDTATPSWSAWRFEQYLHRPFSASKAYVADPEIDAVAFDIFDTLLCRPLIDPEQIKVVVARNAGGELGRTYLDGRASAEEAARARLGRDVDLHAIMAELGRRTGIDDSDVARLLELELGAEAASVAPRPDAEALYKHARANGKRILLVSDMFLPADAIEAMLHRHGFDGWDRLYLSSQVGVRKDSGEMYEHLIRTEATAADKIVMVGDNERSDLQIPGNMGIRTLHVMRPVELARSMPRLQPLIEQIERSGSVDAHLGLGLLVRELFGKLHYEDGFDAASMMPQPQFRDLGYAICGPLAFAFTQWLVQRAQADGISKLYFLAREGQFLKLVYDRVVQSMPDAPPSAYLVVSRRALNVPAIETLDDVLTIAAAHYGPSTLENFLLERYGFTLETHKSRELSERGLWNVGELAEVSGAGMGRLPAVLEALLPDLLSQGMEERPALLAYLAQMGLGGEGNAVVDVGFSGTIQRGLNGLLGGGVHGYYMATLETIAPVAQRYGVHARGAYFDRAPLDDVPVFIGKSFVVEKMLSADDTQVMRYRFENDVPVAQFRALTRAEEAVFPVRRELRRGALAFVDDALEIRENLLTDFQYPLDLAARLFESFVTNMSTRETELIGRVILDDHYCGRGLIS